MYDSTDALSFTVGVVVSLSIRCLCRDPYMVFRLMGGFLTTSQAEFSSFSTFFGCLSKSGPKSEKRCKRVFRLTGGFSSTSAKLVKIRTSCCLCRNPCPEIMRIQPHKDVPTFAVFAAFSQLEHMSEFGVRSICVFVCCATNHGDDSGMCKAGSLHVRSPVLSLALCVGANDHCDGNQRCPGFQGRVTTQMTILIDVVQHSSTTFTMPLFWISAILWLTHQGFTLL